MIDTLKKCGVQFDKFDSEGRSILISIIEHSAVVESKQYSEEDKKNYKEAEIRVITKLLQHGAQINGFYKDNSECGFYLLTPLYIAISNKKNEIVELLINNGAYVKKFASIPDKICYKEEEEGELTVDYLYKKFDEIDHVKINKKEYECFDATKLTEEKKDKIIEKYLHINSPLMLTIFKLDKSLVKLLLQHASVGDAIRIASKYCCSYMATCHDPLTYCITCITNTNHTFSDARELLCDILEILLFDGKANVNDKVVINQVKYCEKIIAEKKENIVANSTVDKGLMELISVIQKASGILSRHIVSTRLLYPIDFLTIKSCDIKQFSFTKNDVGSENTIKIVLKPNTQFFLSTEGVDIQLRLLSTDGNSIQFCFENTIKDSVEKDLQPSTSIKHGNVSNVSETPSNFVH